MFWMLLAAQATLRAATPPVVVAPAAPPLGISGGHPPSGIPGGHPTGGERWILIRLDRQSLTAWEGQRPVREFSVSTGVPPFATPTGVFWIWRRVADDRMVGGGSPGSPDHYDIAHVPYAQYFTGGIALHGAWWHERLGHPVSHGCVNLSTRTYNTRHPDASPDAEWLWNWASLGTRVVVTGTTPQDQGTPPLKEP